MRTKHETFKLHRKEKKVLTKAKIVSVDRLSGFIPEFDVEMLEDVRGFYRKLTLKSSKDDGSPWATTSKGLPFVIIRDFDMTTEVEIPARGENKGLKFEVQFCDLCDIVTAFNAMKKLYEKRSGRRMTQKQKIGKIKSKELK